jgi:uncharacterized protein YbjT (DUF2867 family)
VRVVVIGGTGLIGTRVVENLLDKGDRFTPASPANGPERSRGAIQ